MIKGVIRRMLIPVILSGGSGTRLWPLSREAYPKQLVRLNGGHSLLMRTALRTHALHDAKKPLVVCNENHRFMMAAQLQEAGVDVEKIILEPVGRNTAPATAVAALEALRYADDPLLLIMPADHIIIDEQQFARVIELAIPAALQDKLITFGLCPTKPETGYGYIKLGNKINDHVFEVGEFIEKPDLAAAQYYLDSGEYCWNSGLFLFKASAYLTELALHAPGILASSRAAIEKMTENSDFIRIDAEIFSQCPSSSIDYAIMEKTMNAAVFPTSLGWSDVGSWSALSEIHDKDPQGNVIEGNVHIEKVTNCYIHSEQRLVAAVGVSDHIIVETADAVLVAHKDKCQDVKTIVSRLKSLGHTEPLLHRKVSRPWGSYEILDEADGFKVKRIMVNSGASLSLQQHQHRSEHWTIVRGKATIECGEESWTLNANQSCYIPKQTRHRLTNLEKTQLEVIEVQVGSYLGEDDIERFDDIYGRAPKLSIAE